MAQTIGFGTGMPTGLTFLLPHVLKTTMVADECGSMDFDSLGDMWFSDGPLFACAEAAAARSGGSPALLQVLLRVMPAVFFFQVGATIGEVPPYFVSFASTTASKVG